MNLELKHLAPYLPYKIKCLDLADDTKYSFQLDPINIDGVVSYATYLNTIRLVLRPLSEINSKEHVKFRENYYVDFDRTEGLMLKRINETYTRFNELDYLFENHFDIFGLIEKGLAISIHDVEQADA